MIPKFHVPEEAWHCWVLTVEGGICGRPAVGIDLKRGLCVCEKHRPKNREDALELPEHPPSPRRGKEKGRA